MDCNSSIHPVLPTGGIWGGEFEMRALALKHKRHILVIGKAAVMYYPADEAITAARNPSNLTHSYINFNESGTKYRGQKYHLPAIALESSTLVVMHNGIDHFWTTYKNHEVFGLEAPDLGVRLDKLERRLWSMPSLAAGSKAAFPKAADRVTSPTTEAKAAASSLLQLGRAAKIVINRPRRVIRSPQRYREGFISSGSNAK